MAVLPKSREQTVAWFADRLPDWTANAATIGLTIGQINAIKNRINAAEAALGAANVARTASRDATVLYYAEADEMRRYGADLLKVIKAYAAVTDDPGVYARASVPPPASPSPSGPPDKPTNLSATLLPGGGLRLIWSGTTAQGAYFSVWRKVAGDDQFTLLDSPDAKSFDDTTIPPGTNSLVYFIQARRGNHKVDSIHMQVCFASPQTPSLAVAA